MCGQRNPLKVLITQVKKSHRLFLHGSYFRIRNKHQFCFHGLTMMLFGLHQSSLAHNPIRFIFLTPT